MNYNRLRARLCALAAARWQTLDPDELADRTVAVVWQRGGQSWRYATATARYVALAMLRERRRQPFVPFAPGAEPAARAEPGLPGIEWPTGCQEPAARYLTARCKTARHRALAELRARLAGLDPTELQS